MPITPARPVYLGIDPGAHGGAIALYGNGGETNTFSFSGKTRYQVRDWIEGIERYGTFWKVPIYCVLEQVGGFIAGTDRDTGQKKNIASAHTTFKLGESSGMLQMALVCARISFLEIPPPQWQRRFDISPKRKDETQNQFKNRLKKKAQELFPEERITLALSDAFLLAHLCRTHYQQ